MDEIKGKEPKPKPPSFLSQLLGIPLLVLKEIIGIFFHPPAPAKKEEKKDATPAVMRLSPGERARLEAIERKASQNGFMVKIRFVYLAKKEVFKKAKVAQIFLGSIKQLNTYDMGAFKPDFKKTGVSGSILLFKDIRNNGRKNKTVNAYIDRSAGTGLNAFFLSTEEIATLWHFPILSQVKAPKIVRTEAKKAEAPANIPFEEGF
jgi:hypothetical protein